MAYQFISQKECDLVVIGAGGGGLIAAGRAAWLSKDKAKVIVVDKDDHTGGSGNFASATRIFNSKWQKDRSLPDVTQEFTLKAMDSVYWKLDAMTVSRAIYGTGEFFDWFCSLGPGIADKFEVGTYTFDKPGEGPQVPLLIGRVFHNGSGRYFMNTMVEIVKQNGGEVLIKHKVVDVEVSNGKISAVICETENGHIRIACKACVLASGSWVNHKKVMEKVAPVYLDYLKTETIDKEVIDHYRPVLSGDGMEIAEKVGAFIDWNSLCMRSMGPMFKDMRLSNEVMYTMAKTNYNIMVNLKSKRFAAEPPQVRMGIFTAGNVMMLQPRGMCYAIFDENNLAAAIEESRKTTPEKWAETLPPEGIFLGMPQFPATVEEVKANIAKTLATDTAAVFKADSIGELAKKTGLDQKALEETVANYNASCSAGADKEFFKPSANLVPLTKGPFYAVKGGLGGDGAFGGVLVNPDMQAYAKNGGLVDGLWVVGDFASGKHIAMQGVKIQALNDSSWAYAGGYIAGTNAAKYVETLK